MSDYRYNFSTVSEEYEGKTVAVFRRTVHEPSCRFAKGANVLYGSIAEQMERAGGSLIVNAAEWPPYSRFVGCKSCGTDALFEEEVDMHDIKVGETLSNGAVVVASTNVGENEWAILAVRETEHEPYVTWMGTREDGLAVTFWGHYHQSIESAIADYRERGGR